MAYKSEFNFTATPRIPSMTIICGPYTYFLKDSTGQIEIPIYSGSPCQLVRILTVSLEDIPEPIDPTSIFPYRVSIRQSMPAETNTTENTGTRLAGGGGISASVWTTEDITLYPKGFFPINCANPPYEAERLYLKGWTTDNTTVYTKSATPSSGDSYYKTNGIAYSQNELEVSGVSLFSTINSYDSTNNTITITGENI